MKLLLFSAALITALGLMSFSANSVSGVKRLGETLYQVDATSKLTEADKDLILSTIAENYKLGDYKAIQDMIELDPLTPEPGKKGSWIIKHKLFLAWLEDNFITWETVPASAVAEVAKLNEVISKYADQ